MPILIRIIAQRLLVFVFSILSFFGLDPDLSIPATAVVEERKIEQQEKIDEILHPHSDHVKEEDEQPAVKEVESKITDIQKEFTVSVTNPIVETVKEILPAETVFQIETQGFNVRDVVVNIICLEKTNSYTRLSTGSGVIISSSGLILTNAHVTYPYLKTQQFGSSEYSCSVRRENIPNFGYNAELVYYPADWLEENSEIIKNPSPVGTGENDYALLHITSGIGPTPKTNAFAFASTQVTTPDLKKDTPIVVAGYPSINSGAFEIDTKPGLKIAETKIADFFTFGTQSFDVLQTGINEVAHRGSSGGGIFNDENLYGIVVTTNSNENGSYINALTLPYIKKDFETDTDKSFDEFITYSLDTLRTEFNLKHKAKIKQLISGN
jgi:hypothetical protein